LVVGLCKKVLLANGIGALWDASIAQGAANLTTAGAWIAWWRMRSNLFRLLGYSDMAIGLGHISASRSFEILNYPYISRSITEFWRRWHISLSTWFREYLYIPLGGNRVGVSRWIFNLLVVWMVTGRWHGAAWNFLLWGMYYAVLLILEKLFLLRLLERLPRVFRHIYALLAVLVGWAIFACTSLKECVALRAPCSAAARGSGAATTVLPALLLAMLLVLRLRPPVATDVTVC
jgi:alginate O-acetyltransferase complex protein AlgI